MRQHPPYAARSIVMHDLVESLRGEGLMNAEAENAIERRDVDVTAEESDHATVANNLRPELLSEIGAHGFMPLSPALCFDSLGEASEMVQLRHQSPTLAARCAPRCDDAPLHTEVM
jgi:hypothetical protein